jgi:hypothetical protein
MSFAVYYVFPLTGFVIKFVKIMDKRTSNRIEVHLQTEIRFSDEIVFPGVITNCSENGMYIRTRTLYLLDSKAEIIIQDEKEMLKIPVKVVRIAIRGNIYEGIGVELLHLPENYMEFLIRLNLGCPVNSTMMLS